MDLTGHRRESTTCGGLPTTNGPSEAEVCGWSGTYASKGKKAILPESVEGKDFGEVSTMTLGPDTRISLTAHPTACCRSRSWAQQPSTRTTIDTLAVEMRNKPHGNILHASPHNAYENAFFIVPTCGLLSRLKPERLILTISDGGCQPIRDFAAISAGSNSFHDYLTEIKHLTIRMSHLDTIEFLTFDTSLVANFELPSLETQTLNVLPSNWFEPETTDFDHAKALAGVDNVLRRMGALQEARFGRYQRNHSPQFTVVGLADLMSRAYERRGQDYRPGIEDQLRNAVIIEESQAGLDLGFGSRLRLETAQQSLENSVQEVNEISRAGWMAAEVERYLRDRSVSRQMSHHCSSPHSLAQHPS